MIAQHLELIFTGVAVVVGVLLLLWAASFLVSVAFRRRSVTPRQEVVAPPREGIPPHHVAAITAAVATMTPGAFRIVHVRAPALLARAWAEQGRHELADSHRVRWDWNTTGTRETRLPPSDSGGEEPKDA